MPKNQLVLSTQTRDADVPGYYDLRLDIGKLERRLRGDPCIDRLCCKMATTRAEVLNTFTPGAYRNPATAEVSLNAGYDPGFDEGVLELMIWGIIRGEVCRVLAGADRTRAGMSRC